MKFKCRQTRNDVCRVEQNSHAFTYKITTFEPAISTWREILGLVTDSSWGCIAPRRPKLQVRYLESLGNKLLQAYKSMI